MKLVPRVIEYIFLKFSKWRWDHGYYKVSHSIAQCIQFFYCSFNCKFILEHKVYKFLSILQMRRDRIIHMHALSIPLFISWAWPCHNVHFYSSPIPYRNRFHTTIVCIDFSVLHLLMDLEEGPSYYGFLIAWLTPYIIFTLLFLEHKWKKFN